MKVMVIKTTAGLQNGVLWQRLLSLKIRKCLAMLIYHMLRSLFKVMNCFVFLLHSLFLLNWLSSFIFYFALVTGMGLEDQDGKSPLVGLECHFCWKISYFIGQYLWKVVYELYILLKICSSCLYYEFSYLLLCLPNYSYLHLWLPNILFFSKK